MLTFLLTGLLLAQSLVKKSHNKREAFSLPIFYPQDIISGLEKSCRTPYNPISIASLSSLA